jgi:hypothetical protein
MLMIGMLGGQLLIDTAFTRCAFDSEKKTAQFRIELLVKTYSPMICKDANKACFVSYLELINISQLSNHQLSQII